MLYYEPLGTSLYLTNSLFGGGLFSAQVYMPSYIACIILSYVWFGFLWSSGQSSWLQIRRPGFDSRHYQKKKKKVVGLERGPLSLVSTTEELLDRKVAAPV
jgi:hypothetical protein